MSRPRPAEPHPPVVAPLVRHSWWVPLALVIASLVVLAVVPLLTSTRVRHLRQELTDVSDPARGLVNDLQAVLATQMFALGEIAQGEVEPGRTRYAAALAAQRADETALDSLVGRLGGEPAERFAEFRVLAEQWHAQVAAASGGALHDGAGARGSGIGPRTRDGIGDMPTTLLARSAIDALVRLEAVLGRLSAEQRERIRSVERLDVVLPAVLVPLAIFSALIVFWAGRRLMTLAEVAEHDRRALVASAAARAALMRGVTHDLKNPLGAAAGYAEVLTDGLLGPLSDRQRDTLVRLRNLVRTAVATVNDLMELSRSETNGLRITPVPVDVEELVRDVACDYSAAAEAAQLTVAVDVVPGLPMIVTDPQRVRQTLGNLLSNAVKYTPPGGAVSVHVERRTGGAGRADGVAIEVRDTGPGIPSHLHDRVFEEFFRVPDARSARPGTGVGLAISRRIAHFLGGELTVRSAAGGGSAFTLWLPSALCLTPGMRGASHPPHNGKVP